jgi:hypothetical protein
MTIRKLLLATATVVALTQGAWADDDQYCRSLGAKPGSNAYVECRLRVEEMRRAKARAISRAFMNFGQQMLDLSRPPQPAPYGGPRFCHFDPNLNIGQCF